MRLLLLFFLWPRLALADASLPPRDDLSKCTMSDSPFYQQLLAGPPGMWLRDRAGPNLLVADARHSVLTSQSHPQVQIPRGHTQLVMGEDGRLLGVLALDPEGRGRTELWSPLGKLLWVAPAAPVVWGDSAATLVTGKLLLIAPFRRIATGSALLAFDLETGALEWQAEVLQLKVAHSKYFNDVTLERSGDRLVMRGYEAGGCYRQTFDFATGRRLSAQMPR